MTRWYASPPLALEVLEHDVAPDAAGRHPLLRAVVLPTVNHARDAEIGNEHEPLAAVAVAADCLVLLAEHGPFGEVPEVAVVLTAAIDRKELPPRGIDPRLRDDALAGPHTAGD